MSRYSEIKVEFHDVDCLIEALQGMNLTFQQYETAQPLHDYMGKARKDTMAHIIVDRQNFSPVPVNDVGFVIKDGKVTKAHVDEFFQRHEAKGRLLDPLSARYAEASIRKTTSRMKLRVTSEEKLEDGTLRLRIRR